MAKIKLINSFYDKETGISYVAISTKYGVFEGRTEVHEEDKDIASDFVGCNYAEMKAMIKYEKAKLKLIERDFKKLEIIRKEMETLKEYDKNEVSAKFLRKKYFIAREAVNEQKAKIDFLKDSLYKAMESYREDKTNFDKKIKEIQEKRQETAQE